MQPTQHIHQRMSQRGINQAMVEYTLEHGLPEQDKFVLSRKEARIRLKSIQEEQRVLLKIIDKGGLVVVTEGEALITAYQFNHLSN